MASRLRAVVDTAVDGVILINAKGAILVFNPACERLFGYRAADVLGQNVSMLMPEPDQSHHDLYLQNYHTSGERKIIGIGREVLGRKQDGSTFPIDLSVGEADEDGQPIFVGIIRDLTARNDAVRALHEGALRLRAVVDTAVDGVILIDARGDILMFNPACERLFGYPAAEVIGANVRMLMPEPYRSEHDSYISNYRETGAARIIGIGREVTGLRRDGSTFPMDLSVGEAKQDGASIFVGVIHDLTARKHTEEQLIQAQKMETVGQLSGGIAHDFNNLLTVILGNADALALRLGARQDLKALAEAIAAAAERGAELTQRLLAFSRRQVLQPALVDCNLLVESMQVLLRRTLREDIEISLRLSEAPVLALADRAQLESALINLALNAQDAMPNGGVLHMTTSQVELTPEAIAAAAELRPGRYVSICVTDDGVGMAAHVRERAFEPFFTTKEVGKGSGLGLSMVYGFAKQSNGHVTLYSEPGLGTSVRLYLPLDASGAAPSQESPASPVSAARGDETVLIVEDDPFVRAHVIAAFEALNYQVLVAASGAEALAALRAGAVPNLLFTDIVMPGGLNGWELAAQARSVLPQLRVLFTSGYPQEALLRGDQSIGEAPLLAKPYRIAELAERVRQVLDAD